MDNLDLGMPANIVRRRNEALRRGEEKRKQRLEQEEEEEEENTLNKSDQNPNPETSEDIESEDVSEDESEENVELKDIFQQLQNPKTTDKVIMQLLCVLGNTKRNLPSVEIFQNWDGSET